MTDVPTTFDPPPPARSEMEEEAFAIAERAANWSAEKTNGKLPRWDDCHPVHQINFVTTVITVMAIKAVMEDPKKGSH